MRCRKPLDVCKDSCVPHGVCIEDRACKHGHFQCVRCDGAPSLADKVREALGPLAFGLYEAVLDDGGGVKELRHFAGGDSLVQPDPEKRPTLEPAANPTPTTHPWLYECKSCDRKPGSPLLCDCCQRARLAAGDAWIGMRPRDTQPEPAADAEGECLPGWATSETVSGGFWRRMPEDTWCRVLPEHGEDEKSDARVGEEGLGIFDTPIAAMRAVERKLAETDSDLPEGWLINVDLEAIRGDYFVTEDDGDVDAERYTAWFGEPTDNGGVRLHVLSSRPTRIEAIAAAEAHAAERGRK